MRCGNCLEPMWRGEDAWVHKEDNDKLWIWDCDWCFTPWARSAWQTPNFVFAKQVLEVDDA